MEKVRWGILGTGRIAGDFATGLRALPDAELIAVGSRSAEAADRIGTRFEIARRYPSYETLAHDPDVDVVYVATPHALHHSNTRLCLEAGKAVLCEKPFTLNAAQARDLVDLARGEGLFLMEAMWTRFLPALVEVRQRVAAGGIGEVQFLTADFGFRKEFDPSHRLFDSALGGGALLDVGVYLASLASMFLGRPSEIRSLSQIGPSGVDERAAVVFGYEGGRFAQLTAAITATTPQAATIVGSTGSIALHPLWWRASAYTLTPNGGQPETTEVPYVENGYCHEAAEVMRCLRSGALESPGMPLDETVAVMETLDRVRAQCGLRYPGE